MESTAVFASTRPPEERQIVQTLQGFHGATTKGIYIPQSSSVRRNLFHFSQKHVWWKPPKKILLTDVVFQSTHTYALSTWIVYGFTPAGWGWEFLYAWPELTCDRTSFKLIFFWGLLDSLIEWSWVHSSSFVGGQMRVFPFLGCIIFGKSWGWYVLLIAYSLV